MMKHIVQTAPCGQRIPGYHVGVFVPLLQIALEWPYSMGPAERGQWRRPATAPMLTLRPESTKSTVERHMRGGERTPGESLRAGSHPSPDSNLDGRSSSVDVEAAMARRDSDSQSPSSDTGSSSDPSEDTWTRLNREDGEEPKDGCSDGQNGASSSRGPAPGTSQVSAVIVIHVIEPGGPRHSCFVRGCRRVFQYAWQLREHISMTTARRRLVSSKLEITIRR